MGAATEYYVDPTNGNDTTGDGSISTPWATVQKALDTITQDTTNGDRINLRDTSDDVLSSKLSFATYGTPNVDYPLIIQGYTTSAGDGGIGGISGGGSVAVIDDVGVDAVILIDLHMHNCGSQVVVRLDNWGMIYNCEVDNTTGDGIECDQYLIKNCYVHNVGGRAIEVGNGVVYGCYVENGTNDCSAAIQLGPGFAFHNIIDIDGASFGIDSGSQNFMVCNNTVYSNAGTGVGIDVGGGDHQGFVANNIVEGFSGVGGKGLDINSDGGKVVIMGNKLYNNTTNFDNTSAEAIIVDANEILSASPFTDPANNDFSVDTTVKAGAYPSTFTQEGTNTQYMDSGALQREEVAASGGQNWW